MADQHDVFILCSGLFSLCFVFLPACLPACLHVRVRVHVRVRETKTECKHKPKLDVCEALHIFG